MLAKALACQLSSEGASKTRGMTMCPRDTPEPQILLRAPYQGFNNCKYQGRRIRASRYSKTVGGFCCAGALVGLKAIHHVGEGSRIFLKTRPLHEASESTRARARGGACVLAGKYQTCVEHTIYDQTGFSIYKGSLHYTPEHCHVHGGVPLFCWKKPCFKCVSFKEPCFRSWVFPRIRCVATSAEA